MDNQTQMFSQCIQKCAEALSHRGSDSNAARADCRFVPQYPLVNVFWEAFKGKEIVKSVFSDFWPSGPLVGTLVEYMDGSCTGDNTQELRGMLRMRAIGLLENRVIANTDTLRIAHYIPLSAPNREQLIGGICDIHAEKLEGINAVVYPIFFLFNDYNNFEAHLGFEKMLKSHKIINEKLKDGSRRQIVALGPTLRDNSFIRRGQEEENYRIAADIAFLSSTMPNSRGTPTGLSAWLDNGGATLQTLGSDVKDTVVTASFLQMQKPSGRIAAVTLDTLRRERIRLAEDKEKELISLHAHDNATQFLSEMKLNKSIASFDNVFNECIRPNLPDASSLEPIIQWDQARKAGSYEEANGLTAGALQLFARRYFSVRTLDGINAEELADHFSGELMKQTDYLFAEHYFKTCAQFLKSLRPESPGGIYNGLVNLARTDFYALMIPKLEEALLRRAEEARRFRLFLQDLAVNLLLPPSPPEPGLENVDDFYRNQAESLIDFTELTSMLQPCAEEESLFTELENAFRTLITKNPSVYLTSLEDEVKHRTVPSADGTAPNVIAAFFGTDLSNKQRLPVLQVDTQNTQGFYLIHADAAIGTNQQDRIQTVRTEVLDRAERLQLYYVDISSLSGRGDA